MIIYSKLLVKVLTLGFARGITIYPFIFISDEFSDDTRMLNHEKIHMEQYKELLWIGFVVLYVLNWLFLFCKYWDFELSYRSVMFESEAYNHDDDQDYLSNRKSYAWWSYRK